MKKNKKIITTLVVIVVVIVGVILILEKLSNNQENKGNQYENEQEENELVEKYVEELDDGRKINISNKLKETKKLEGLEISNIQLTYENNQSIILANIENKSKEDVEMMLIEVILYDDEENEIDRLNGLISNLKKGKTTQLNIGTQNDCVNAYDFSVKKK